MLLRILCLVMICLLHTGVFSVEQSEREAARALEAYKAATPPDQVATLFEAFCRTHFGAEHEPLVYEQFGEALSIAEEGAWHYASAYSVCIAWETNLPANSWVEYGIDNQYGQKSAIESRWHYIHVRHIVDLKPNTTYHYRLVSTDERGNTVVSSDRTFTTAAIDDFVVIPKDAVFPYKLDRENTTYLLTHDVHTDGSAFEIHANGVCLDLGGRTVVYHNKTLDKAVFTDKWMSYVHKGVFGLKSVGHSRISLLNGSLVEGVGRNRGNNESTGFNPVYIRDAKDVTMSGLQVDYWNPQTVGIRLRKCTGHMELKHSVFYDRGNMMHNRHGDGCASISNIACDFDKQVIRHCLVKRTRQNGLRTTGKGVVHNCEIYVDSWATNSFASGAGVAIYNNRIFCTGYHAISVPWGDGVKVHDNFIHMEGINTGKTRWWEGFGDQNSMNGLRHTQWGKNRHVSDNSDYFRNTVVIDGKHGGMVRGVEFFSDPYIRNLVLRDSTIKVVSLDEQTNLAACVATHGYHNRRDLHLPVTYKNCRFISNINILRLGDSYGRGDNHYFFNCTFERIGQDKRFNTVRGNSTYASQNHALRDCIFVGCVADDVDWGDAGPRSYRVQHGLAIEAKPGTAFTITDAIGNESFKGVIGKSGSVMIPLTQYTMSNHPEPRKTMLTPHTLKISEDGKEKILSVTMSNHQVYKNGEFVDNQINNLICMDINLHSQMTFSIKDQSGVIYLSGTMGSAGSLRVPLPSGVSQKENAYTISGVHADGERFSEFILLNEARLYTAPLSKASIAALVAKESEKK